MKILLVHKYYFPYTGPERYLFNFKKVMEGHGHEIIPFAINFSQTVDNPYRRYFLNPPAGTSEIGMKEFSAGLLKKLKVALNSFYSVEAAAKIKQIIRHTKPDVAYLLSIYNYISPSVIGACKEFGLPVVMRLSDYNLLCANALGYRNNELICKLCFGGNYYHAIKYRCVHNSLSSSFVRALGMYFYKYCRFYENIDAFVCTNQAIRDQLEQVGFQNDKLHFIQTPVDIKAFTPSMDRKKIILFSGKVNQEKGIGTLIDAFLQIGDSRFRLIIAGDDRSHYGQDIITRIKKRGEKNIEFIGHQNLDEIKKLNKDAAVVVVPSLCLENAPNSLTEALAAGTPVIVSRVPGTMGMFTDGVEGLYFESGNVDDLAGKIRTLIDSEDIRERMGKNARTLAEKDYSPQKHYDSLMQVYNELIEKR